MPYTVRPEHCQRYPSNHWDEVYRGLIAKAVKRAGLDSHRDKEDFSSRQIIGEVWKKIEEADIVVCDLSSANPNAFLELGWTLRADKPFVLLKDDLTDFPFDLNQLNTFVYSHDLRPLALEQQVRVLAKMLVDTLRDSERKYSFVHGLDCRVPAPCSVDIYYHRSGLTRRDGEAIAVDLRHRKFDAQLREHDSPDGPDAIFIGAMVDAASAKSVMRHVRYPVKYLFRPDCPESEGGDSRGNKIGIGYSSAYNGGRRSERAEPIALSPEDVAELMKDDHTNSSFHRALWSIALRSRLPA